MCTRTNTIIFGLILFAYVCVVNGAIPGYTAPTTAQIVWTMGFAKSFVHDGYSIYAHNFGIPRPAAIAFGLTGALTAAAFVKAGLLPVDAYSAAVVLWLGIAFVGSFALARFFGNGRPSSLLLATAWLTLPVVWVHHIFGLTALGFALLPFYMLAATRLIGGKLTLPNSGFFVAACFIAVFMDGYSFMMFAVASVFIFVAGFLKSATNRALLLAVELC